MTLISHPKDNKFCFEFSVHIDKDECTTGEATCFDVLGVCINTPGNYSCKCTNGYSGDGRSSCEGKIIIISSLAPLLSKNKLYLASRGIEGLVKNKLLLDCIVPGG